jgi:hypothetical protein
MNHSVISCAAALALSLPCSLFAGQQPNTGFNAEVTIGAAIISSADNLLPGSSESTLNSLDQGAKTTTKVLPIVLPELSYRFGVDGRSSWYFNLVPTTVEAGFFAPTTGMTHTLPGIATFDAGFFYLPMAEVYKNPYVVGQRRQETDVVGWGSYLAANDIANTPLRLQAALLTADVDDDQLAGLFPSLARDGEIYELSVGYGLLQGQPFSLKPQVSLRKGEFDGEASSFTKIKVELAGMYIAGRFFFMPRLSYSHSEHDERDPVFDDILKENGYGLNLLVKYQGLMDIEQLGLLAIAGYSISDANENFYDSETLVCGLGLSYSF